jgi:hypothetical protein
VWQKSSLVWLAVGFILGYFASPYLRGHSSIEECYLKTMKGQRESMRNTALAFCRLEFPLPAKVSTIAPTEEKFVRDPNAVDLSSFGTPVE